MKYVAISLALVILILPIYVCAGKGEPLQGRVVEVIDGDSIKVKVGDRILNVQLWGIDSPEIGQPYGIEAKFALNQLVADSMIDFTEVSTNRFNRIVAKVGSGPYDSDICRKMIELGFAWHDKWNAPNAVDFAEAEILARKKSVGIWKTKNPPPPWHFSKVLQCTNDIACNPNDSCDVITKTLRRHGDSCGFNPGEECVYRKFDRHDDPDLPLRKGEWQVTYTIGSSGRIIEGSIADIKPKEISDCVVEYLPKIIFPDTIKKTKVTVRTFVAEVWMQR